MYLLILKKSVAWVKCIWQSADTKHEQMYEQNLIFPFCALEFMRNSNCETKNGFAVAVSRAVEKGGAWAEGLLFLSFDFFLATLERNHSYCLLKGFILIVYIIIIKLKLLLDKKLLMWYFIYNIYKYI